MWVGNFKLQEPLPELRQPHVIGSLSPWVDVGRSATIALERLERDIDARDLASLANPGRYFDFTRYRPTIFSIEGRRETSIPNVHVRYARGHAGIDFVTMHLLEPHANTDEYVDSIVELMRRLGVKRYCRIGSMWSDVPHTRPLPVMATLNGEDMGLPGTMSRQQRRYSGRTSIMNLVGTRALEQGIEDANILARLPSIARLEEDHNGASRLLGTLCYMYGFPDRLAENQEGHTAVPAGLEADRAEPRAQVLPQGAGGHLRFLGCLGGDKTAGAAVLDAAGVGTAPGRLGRAALGQPPSSTSAE